MNFKVASLVLVPSLATRWYNLYFDHVALLSLVVNLANSWCSLYHQVTPLTLVTNLATRWRKLHWFQFWPLCGATCIGCKFGHQVAPLALPHCPIDIISWYCVVIFISQSHIGKVCKRYLTQYGTRDT